MKYFSMFSGIGGFEYGIEQAFYNGTVKTTQAENLSQHCSDRSGSMGNGRESGPVRRPVCVGYSEINKYASAIYQYHYPDHKNYGNAKDLVPEEIPDFDLLVGGFPCQAFSIAGKRGGFDDTRGTLFFDVARVLKAKLPDWFLLENVKGLCSHDAGKTMRTIYGVLTDLGYTVGWEVVNSCKFGVPQNRERIFFVGHLTEAGGRVGEVLPIRKKDKGTTQRAEQTPVARTFTAGGNLGGFHSSMTLVKSGTWRTHKDGRGFRELENPDISPCIPARAREDGSGQPVVKVPEFIPEPDDLNNTVRSSGFKSLTAKHNHDHIFDGAKIRRLTPTECERLQGFPDGWTKYGFMDGEQVEISDTQRYKALGNAVTTNVIEAFMRKIYDTI